MRVDPERLQPRLGRRHANQSAPVLRHEIDRIGRHLLRRHDQIAFIFAVGVVGDDDHPPLTNVFQAFLDGIEGGALRIW